MPDDIMGSGINDLLTDLDPKAVVASALALYVAYTYILRKSRLRVLVIEVPFWVGLFFLTDIGTYGGSVFKVFVSLHVIWRYVRSTGPSEPVDGAVFVTGADSGMGLNTAQHLATVGYHVFAGCYSKDSFKLYEGMENVTPLVINVKDEPSVKKAVDFIRNAIEGSKGKISGLYGVLQCAGISYVAPFEYIPMTMFKDQVEVNYFGYVYVAQAFLPLVKEYTSRPGARRGRFCFVSSGPLPGPGVPFITSYLGAKWAGDALCQGLRVELKLRQLPIDCCMLSPGVVKPTRLAEEGQVLLERSFEAMPAAARDEYYDMIDAFRRFQLEEPGTHVSQVGKQMERIMQHGRPYMRYYVGPDAVASTVVGVLPTGLREFLLRNTLMKHYKDCPRFIGG